MRIATIIIESGALYSCFYVCIHLSYQYALKHSFSQISGIILFKWSSVAVIVILGLLTQMAVSVLDRVELYDPMIRSILGHSSDNDYAAGAS